MSMAKSSASKIKNAIIAIEAERAMNPDAPRLKLGENSNLQRIRQAKNGLLVEFLEKAGLDTRKLSALGKKHDIELKRATAKYHAEAIRRARKKGAYHRSVMDQAKAIVAITDPNAFASVVEPFLIWATPRSNIISDSQVAPTNSWVKFRVSSSGDDTYKVSFYFLWSNPNTHGVVIDPFTFVIATGFIEADADRAYWLANVSNVGAEVDFYLWQWWDQSQAPILSATASLGHVSAVSEYFQTDTESQSIAAGVMLDAGTFFVPGGSTAVFEVAISTSFYSDDGTAFADFESGNFNITVPLISFPIVVTPF
jgi:hypothetical protein